MKQSIQNEATVFETIEKSDSVKKQLQLRKNKASIHLLLSNDFSCCHGTGRFRVLYEELLDCMLEELREHEGYQTSIIKTDGKYELYYKVRSTRKVNCLFSSSAEAKEHAVNRYYKKLNADLNRLDLYDQGLIPYSAL